MLAQISVFQAAAPGAVKRPERPLLLSQTEPLRGDEARNLNANGGDADGNDQDNE